MLKTRIITAVIGIPALLFILYLGGWAWYALFVLLGLIALYEYLTMMQKNGRRSQHWSGYILLLLLLLRGLLGEYFPPLLLLLIIALLLECVLWYPHFNLEDIALKFLGAFYIGFLLSFALQMLTLEQPFIIILLVLLVTWGSDIGGYLFGRLWGKSKMAPFLSPNKTWAGAIGGVFLATVAALGFHCLAPLPGITSAAIIILAIVGAGAAQLGDLFASAIKRCFGAKDSGYIIPGHGGVLDRFDSFLLVLPVIYYLIYFLR